MFLRRSFIRFVVAHLDKEQNLRRTRRIVKVQPAHLFKFVFGELLRPFGSRFGVCFLAIALSSCCAVLDCSVLCQDRRQFLFDALLSNKDLLVRCIYMLAHMLAEVWYV